LHLLLSVLWPLDPAHVSHLIVIFIVLIHLHLIHLCHDLADVVQEHVHETQAPRVGDDLVARKGRSLEKLLLRLVELEFREIVVSGEEKAPRSAGRVGDRLVGLGRDTFDHRADKRARGEILAGA
jgi:hypothetical protein